MCLKWQEIVLLLLSQFVDGHVCLYNLSDSNLTPTEEVVVLIAGSFGLVLVFFIIIFCLVMFHHTCCKSKTSGVRGHLVRHSGHHTNTARQRTATQLTVSPPSYYSLYPDLNMQHVLPGTVVLSSNVNPQSPPPSYTRHQT